MQMRPCTRCEQANVDLQPKTSSVEILCSSDCKFREKKGPKGMLVGKRSGSLRCYSGDDMFYSHSTPARSNWFQTNQPEQALGDCAGDTLTSVFY